MKRILATILSVMLVATLAISGTVAYLTDDESAVNVMTVGKVNIKLHEEQRTLDNKENPIHDNATPLEAFEDDKNLMPITNDGEGNDTWGLSKESNYVDKIVRVENTGESDAWVRVFVAIPTELDKNINGNGKPLHWNLGYDDTTTATGSETSEFADAAHPTADYNEEFGKPELMAKQSIDGIDYNIYCFTRTTPLAADPKVENGVMIEDDWTAAVMVGFYLDPAVDFNDKELISASPYYPYYMGDKSVPENQIKYNLDNDIKIPVYVQAIQAEGFENSVLAFAGADGDLKTEDDTMPWNPWAKGTMLEETIEDQPVAVSSFAGLKAALEHGGEIKLEKDITISPEDMNTTAASIPVGIFINNNTVLDLNGNNLIFEGPGDNNGSAAIFVHDANLTIKGDGDVDQKDGYGYVIWAKGESVVNIEGGDFVGATPDSSVLYASGNVAYDKNSPWATINVYGGTFTSGNPTDWQDCTNIMDHGVGRINFYGGTFNWDPSVESDYAWDPATSYHRNDDIAYVQPADGYTVNNNGDGTWTVVEETAEP